LCQFQGSLSGFAFPVYNVAGPEVERGGGDMTQVTLQEAQARLPDLVDAAVRGEEVVIERSNRPAVRLTPVAARKPQPRFGSAHGLLTVPDDFDAPLDEFRDYAE
jgi:prevent-host-death family protein